MKRIRHTPEQIIRKLKTAEQLLGPGQDPGFSKDVTPLISTTGGLRT